MILQASNLSKKFFFPEPLELLKEINLTVEAGQALAIMGRSGEGKSTLLHILGALDIPSSGKLFIASQSVDNANKAKLRNEYLGFIFQAFYLLEDYTVLQNVLMPAFIARKDISLKSASYERAITLLEKVGLQDRMHHFAKQLSGGEKQRAAIARALCNNPKLLLADEPSGNLDRKTAQVIHELLLSFVHEENKSLIVVTHDIELARLCQMQYRLQSGLLEKIC